MQTGTGIDMRRLTELDAARLRKLLVSQQADELARLLDEAELVPGTEIEPDVITMYTQFELEDAAGGGRRLVALCYPTDAEPGSGFVSVLSPLGRSALGLRAGAQVTWSAPGGPATARIGAVLFQPEASGDYLT